MNLAIITLIAVVLALAIACRAFAGERLLPGHLRERTCQGRAWRRAFPEASKQDIRDFLSVFVKAFAFHNSERLKFSPSDSILSVYRELYPQRWTPDGLEVETLAKALHKHYGVTLGAIWDRDLTLGELFAHARGTYGKAESVTRIGCGALVGCVLGAGLAMRLALSSYGVIGAVIALAICLCAFLALKYGDRFWSALFNLEWW